MPTLQVRQKNNTNRKLDDKMMQRAIVLARKGEGYVEPNPMVGCVITRNGKIIGEGYHRRFGGAHAEINALHACKRSKKNPKGATVYVTLEPCCHHGKTPPCTEALIEANIARVVIAQRDPNPTVNNRGITQLKRAGIKVETDVLANEAAKVFAPYLKYTQRKQPYLIAKWAQSLDGKLSNPTGKSQWISCDASRKKVHRLRARIDGILVGIETVLSDNPLLTARNVPIKRIASRIVMDTRLRIPEQCKLITSAKKIPTIVFTSSKSSQSQKAKRLKKRGVEIISCRTSGKHLAVSDVLKKLYQRGMTNVMIEGGAAILSSFFRAKKIDEAWIFSALDFIGDQSAPMIQSFQNVASFTRSLRPEHCHIKKSGTDTFYKLMFH